MAARESSSPVALNKEKALTVMDSISPVFSPSSDKQLWSSLRNRVDTLLDNQNQSLPAELNGGRSNRVKRLKEDSMLLLTGFDSVSSTLSQLSTNLEFALQGAKDLAGPPTLSEIVHSSLENTTTEKEQSNYIQKGETNEVETKEGNRGLKRKTESQDCGENEQDDTPVEDGQSTKGFGKLEQAKTIAISMGERASSLAKELKSVKSDIYLMQHRCALLEEENVRFRNGVAKGIIQEEDDLMRLQMEALLSEKSNLAIENANLTRENEYLNQLVEYHQLTSQESYEHEPTGIRLDFSSPQTTTTVVEEFSSSGATMVEEERDHIERDHNKVPRTDLYGFSAGLSKEQHC